IVGSFRFVKQRKYNQKILKDLKLVYNNTCQVCGTNMNELYKCSILECHHIEYFSLSQNNNIDNLLIVCPNCHRQIHKLDLKYDKKSETLFNDKGFRKKIAYNKHLKY
ncbi:MAG: HNH endonuclease, partial [Clostridia bacterium]|nr:HNH endonuclease [Clostridia bacterium]